MKNQIYRISLCLPRKFDFSKIDKYPKETWNPWKMQSFKKLTNIPEIPELFRLNEETVRIELGWEMKIAKEIKKWKNTSIFSWKIQLLKNW